MVSKGEVVLVQVSAGSADISNPGLNIIGGIQPRGLRLPIPGMSGIVDDAAGWFTDVEGAAGFVSELACPSIDVSCICLWSSICGAIAMDVDRPAAEVRVADSTPRPGPDSRMASGRHCTLPWPLARMLSTHDGNAPVLLYRENMASESS